MASNLASSSEKPKRLYPFDRVAISVIILLSVLLGSLMGLGGAIAPSITQFSWRDRPVSARDRAFTLTFAQPIVPESVETNLQISPKLPGKISWSAETLHYTLTAPPQYGTRYQLRLQGAKAAYGELGQPGRQIQPFQGQFQTRDRVFAYLGVNNDERDQLILYNLTRQKKLILTPPDLLAIDFKPYPDGQRILFSAVARDALNRRPSPVQLYTVTTGLNFTASQRNQPPGRVKQILDATHYQNLQFDLSPDGKRILVERSNRLNPADTSLWILPENSQARSLGIQGDVFRFTPDSQRVAVVQEGGVSLIPLTPQAQALEFLPGYEALVGFTEENSAQLWLKPHADGTRSLILKTTESQPQELLRTQGFLRNCQFSPQQKNILYCLRIGGEQQLQEQPVLSIVDLEQKRETPFLALVNDREVVLSMAPDGSAILFDQVLRSTSSAPGSDNFKANIWYLPLPEIEPDQQPLIKPPEKLTPGLNPIWLP